MDLIAAAAALAQLLILKSSQNFPELESSVLFYRFQRYGENWVLADHATNCEQFIGGLCNRGYYKCSV
jgi:hypothetical protein